MKDEDVLILVTFVLQVSAVVGTILTLRKRLRDKNKRARIGWSALVCLASVALAELPAAFVDWRAAGVARPWSNNEIALFIVLIFSILGGTCIGGLAMAVYYIFKSPKTTRQIAQDQAAEIIRAAEEKASAILRAAGKASIGMTNATGTAAQQNTSAPNRDEPGPAPEEGSKMGAVIVGCILMLFPILTALSVIRKGVIMSELSGNSLPTVLSLTAGVSLVWFGYRMLWIPRRRRNRGK
jgi:hypothetical protein